ncbi:SUMF1/EgtB/PvdO family nonheme iron enzyme [Myxococcota bacterium]|nr:SUMF1/EgtB/PvdO family nonheme iron enzyme [Myxococcota bacterium]
MARRTLLPLCSCLVFLSVSVVARAQTPEPLPCGTVPAGMACVPGGSFIRGSDDGPADSRPASTVWVQTFVIDVNEVTVRDFFACVKEKKCPKAGPLYTGFSEPDMPINGISWFDADNYCRVHGKRLPTEAEWEKAARGTDGRIFPWGNEPATCERAIIEDKSGKGCGRKKPGSHPEKGRPWAIGSRPANPYGIFDMAGNSYEWVNDWYTKSWAACGEACAGVDPRGPCDGAAKCPGYRQRSVRGGSWYWPADNARTFHRRAYIPLNKPAHHFGFRCAASVE